MVANRLSEFEQIVRRTKHNQNEPPTGHIEGAHPFDERNVEPAIAGVARQLFDDGHFSQATFEAFKYLDLRVAAMSGIRDSGYKLMMAAFNENSPKIKLTSLLTQSEIDEQLGYRNVFAGVMSAIRNPRGHNINFDTIDVCLDHWSIASVLLRRLEQTVP